MSLPETIWFCEEHEQVGLDGCKWVHCDKAVALRVAGRDDLVIRRRTFIVSQHDALHQPTCYQVKRLKNPRTMRLTPDEVERSFLRTSCCWRYSTTSFVRVLDWLEKEE